MNKGNVGLGQAIAYFTSQNYAVSIPLNDTQWYDLIVEKDGCFHSVQVKYTGAQKPNGNYECALRTVSGSSRATTYTVKDTPVEWLFIYCSDGTKYLIPTTDFENRNSITLGDKFKSYKVV